MPDPLKLKALAKTLGELGLSAGGLLGVDPHKGLQDVLARAQSHPLADIINSLIVRSMRQAVYSPESAGISVSPPARTLISPRLSAGIRT